MFLSTSSNGIHYTKTVIFMAHSLCIRQCGKYFTSNILSDFQNCFSRDTIFVPHFTVEKTEVWQDKVTSLQSQSGKVAEAGLQPRSEQPQSVACTVYRSFGNHTHSLHYWSAAPRQSALPQLSIIYLFLCNQLRFFSIWLFYPQPHASHLVCELVEGVFFILFLFLLQSLPGEDRQYPHHMYNDSATWPGHLIQLRGTALEGCTFTEALWSVPFLY